MFCSKKEAWRRARRVRFVGAGEGSSQKSRKETRVRRASPLARRAIPNCQTDGSLPGAEPVLLPSTPAPPPSPSAPAPSPPLYGEPPAPRADRPRKSRLYWKRSGPRDYRVFIIHAIDACSKGRERNLERIKLLSTMQSD